MTILKQAASLLVVSALWHSVANADEADSGPELMRTVLASWERWSQKVESVCVSWTFTSIESPEFVEMREQSLPPQVRTHQGQGYEVHEWRRLIIARDRKYEFIQADAPIAEAGCSIVPISSIKDKATWDGETLCWSRMENRYETPYPYVGLGRRNDYISMVDFRPLLILYHSDLDFIRADFPVERQVLESLNITFDGVNCIALRGPQRRLLVDPARQFVPVQVELIDERGIAQKTFRIQTRMGEDGIPILTSWEVTGFRGAQFLSANLSTVTDCIINPVLAPGRFSVAIPEDALVNDGTGESTKMFINTRDGRVQVSPFAKYAETIEALKQKRANAGDSYWRFVAVAGGLALIVIGVVGAGRFDRKTR